MREQGLAARRKKKRRATTRPGKGRWRAPDLVKRDFPAQQDQHQVVRRRHRDQDRRGQALPGLGDGHGLPAGARVRARRAPRRASWPTARWPWRWRCAAARSPASSCTPTRGSEYTAGLVRQACAAAGHLPVDGPARVRAGQRGHRVLALHPGIRAPLSRALRHQGSGPGPGQRLDRGLQHQTGGTPRWA